MYEICCAKRGKESMLRCRRGMNGTFKFLLLSVFCFLPRSATGLMFEFPKHRPLHQHCEWPLGLAEVLNHEAYVGGEGFNFQDFFCYSGDSEAFNDFIAQYARLPNWSANLKVHMGNSVYSWVVSVSYRVQKKPEVAEIPLEVDFPTDRIKIYLDTKSHPGYNAIDAVALVDKEGNLYWAVGAEASSTAADSDWARHFSEDQLRVLREGTRVWGPGQAVGEPDLPGKEHGGRMVWRPRGMNSGVEWIMLEFPKRVRPAAVRIHESGSTGAVIKVSVFDRKENEIEAWTGEDPAPAIGNCMIQLGVFLGGRIDWHRVRIPENLNVLREGNTDMHYAIADGSAEALTQLLDQRADPNAKNDQGKTPLHLAIVREQDDLARLLLDRGAEVNTVDNEGNTPLHAAAMCGDMDLVRALTRKGANAGVRNQDGKTPLELLRKIISEREKTPPHERIGELLEDESTGE